MNNRVTTAILHMRETLNGQRRIELEETLKEDTSVLSVGSPERFPRLLMVGYDPTGTSPGSIINRVTRAGLSASIVGCA